MRNYVLSIGLILVVGSVLMSDPPKNFTERSAPTATPPQRYPWDNDADFAVRERLKREYLHVKFVDTALLEVFDDFAERADLMIHTDWPALEASAVQKDLPMTLRATRIDGAHLLKLIIDTVGAGETELTYEIRGGMIRISTGEALSRERMTWVYDCADLLNADEKELTEHIHRVFAAVAKYSGRDIARDGADAEKVVRQVVESSREKLRERLISTIQNNIDPESWREAGGNTGSIDVLGDRLVVTQSCRTQERVFDLLQQLRQTRPAQATGERWP